MRPNAYPPPLEKGSGSRVTLVHGFAQTNACWGPFGESLAARHACSFFDSAGHGGASGLVDYDCDQIAEGIVGAAGPGAYVGYSMGARVFLHAALSSPESVTKLVLISGTAGIESDGDRTVRRTHDDERAERILEIGVEQFIDEWLQMPMFAGLEPWARFEEERSRNTAEGLANSLKHAGTGSMAPLWDRLEELEMPVLCLAGGNDAAYVEHAERLVVGIGSNAELAVVSGVGHSPHLEAAGPTADLVLHFLAT